MKTRPSAFGAPSIARQGTPCLPPAEQCSALQGRARRSARAVVRTVEKVLSSGRASFPTPERRARSGAPYQPISLHAFTRLELVALLASLTLLAAVILPALAGPRQRSERLVCASNLRQIGTGFQLWGSDYGDQAPQEVPVANGGTRIHPLAANAWLHFSWLSNELNSAALLFCPSDSGQPARDFTGDPTGGYVHPNFANRATSYFVAHLYNGAPGPPNSPLAGDRNVGSDNSGGCSRFNNSQIVNRQPASGTFAWTTNLHNKNGNLLRLDGRVEQFSNAELRAHITPSLFESAGSFHFVVPR